MPVEGFLPFRERYSFQRGDYPVAETASDRVLSLPLYPAMTEADVDRVIGVVRKIIGASLAATYNPA